MKITVDLHLSDHMEIVAGIRDEVVAVLMRAADIAEAEDGIATAKRLRDVAFDFDAGMSADRKERSGAV